MATKIDLGKVANDLLQVGTNYLNKLVGSGGSPLNQPVTTNQVKVGNVGGIFGINLNITTLLLIAVGIVAVIFIGRKLT